MTTKELSNEFDILWDNLRNNDTDTPSVNEYEKSIFLTQAQEDWILANVGAIDTSDLIRQIMLPITKRSGEITIASNIVTKDDSWWIILQESLSDSTPIKPVRYDEINVVKDDPFVDAMLRIQTTNSNVEQFELIGAVSDTDKYNCIYLSKPSPVILDGVDTLVGSDTDYNIRGSLDTHTFELSPIIHETILKQAVSAAYQSLYINNSKN